MKVSTEAVDEQNLHTLRHRAKNGKTRHRSIGEIDVTVMVRHQYEDLTEELIRVMRITIIQNMIGINDEKVYNIEDLFKVPRIIFFFNCRSCLVTFS